MWLTINLILITLGITLILYTKTTDDSESTTYFLNGILGIILIILGTISGLIKYFT